MSANNQLGAANWTVGEMAPEMYLANSPMLIVPTLFWLLLALCCGFAAAAGGRSGRIGAMMLIAATVATLMVESSRSWANTHQPVMMIDILLMFGLFALAMRSEHYWPIWATGFHLLTVAGHFASIIMPGFRLGVYWRFSGIWALLVLMSMAVGISYDRTYWRRSGRPA